eukprot:33594-Eustigmatos_ZCMA.PRE.1
MGVFSLRLTKLSGVEVPLSSKKWATYALHALVTRKAVVQFVSQQCARSGRCARRRNRSSSVVLTLY